MFSKYYTLNFIEYNSAKLEMDSLKTMQNVKRKAL